MIFKNATIYEFTEKFVFDDNFADTLSEMLTENSLGPIGDNDLYRLGWVPAFKSLVEELVFSHEGKLLIKLGKLEKIIPAPAINKALSDRVAEIENAQARKVPARERRQLREEIIHDLLPRALVKESGIMLYIDPVNRLLVVDTVSAKSADEVTSYLRKTLGSLPIRQIELERSITESLTSWAQDPITSPKSLEIFSSAVFKGSEGEQATFKDNLSKESVDEVVSQGMRCTELLMSFEGEMFFKLNDQLQLKSIKWDTSGDDFETEEDYLSTGLFILSEQIRRVTSVLRG